MNVDHLEASHKTYGGSRITIEVEEEWRHMSSSRVVALDVRHCAGS